jgi:hypothetical protein
MDLHAELVRLKAAPELPEWIVGAVQSLIVRIPLKMTADSDRT